MWALAGVVTLAPEQSARLAEAPRTAGVDHIIENYVGIVVWLDRVPGTAATF